MINIIYIYPNINFINNEINICRIIDEKIKETIAIYGIKRDYKLQLYITNTFTGDNKILENFCSIEDIINFIKYNENEIKMTKSLECVEKYILNKKN